MKTELRVSKIDVKESLGPLHAFDVKVSRANPALLPRETKEELLDFLTKEYNSETWLWRNSNGDFVAYISLIDEPKEGAMEVLRICVDPALQGKGIGKLLMKFAEKMAVELGRKKMKLATSTKNLQAIGFYQKLGYRIVKEVENYYGEGEIRYICEKTLHD